MGAEILGWKELRAEIPHIPSFIKRNIKPIMERGAESIVSMQKSLVHVESPPGAHARRKANPYPAGTLKAGLKWYWDSRSYSKIIINDFVEDPAPHNLGIWLEKGTRAGTYGDAYRYTYWRRRRMASYHQAKNGKWIETARRYLTSNARTMKRTHPGTAPHPFFLPAWHALLPGIRDEIVAAYRMGIQQALMTSTP